MNATPLRAALLTAVVLFGASGAAHGAVFTVTTTADSGADSLREAIEDANASTDASNTISFTLPASSTITLTTALENITSQTLIFDATASTGLIIDGPGTSSFLTFATSSTSAQFHTNTTFTDGILTFSESDSGAIAGTLRGGALTVTKTGAGTTTLAGTGDIILGAGSAVRVEQGVFAVDGDLTAGSFLASSGTTVTVNGTITAANSLTMSSGSTLDLNGDISGVSVLVGPSTLLTGNGGTIAANTTLQGTVSPSTTAGTLAISGPATFTSTSLLDLDLSPAGGGDQITMPTGTVTVQSGARLVFRTNPTAFAGTQTYTVVNSNGASGAFTLGTDYAFLDETFIADANDIVLQLTPNGFTLADFAFTPNQQAVASQIGAASAGATGDLADALDAINQSSAAEMPELLDSLGGETLTSFATGRQILAERTARALHRRTRDGVWGEARGFYLPPIEKPSLLDELFHAGAWLDAFGLYGELDGDRGEAEVDTVLGGGTLGVDAWLGESLVGGLAAGYARIDLDAEDRNAEAYGDAIQGALYAGFTDPRGYVSVYGRYAYTFQDSSRRISASELHRSAHASWEAQDYGAGAEAGLTILSLGGVGLQPIAGIDWLRLDEESYRERSAGSLGLDVDPEVLDSTTARFGGRLFGRVVMGNLGVLVPELRAFWQREYGDRDRVLNARLIGAPQVGPSGVRGPELPSEVVILGAGWGVHIGNNLTVTLDYDALLDSDRVEHQGNIAARWLF